MVPGFAGFRQANSYFGDVICKCREIPTLDPGAQPSICLIDLGGIIIQEAHFVRLVVVLSYLD